MTQNQRSNLTTESDGEHSPRGLIDRKRLTGLAVVLIGISQVLLGLSGLAESSWSGLTESSWVIFVLGGGGWLLIGIGVNLLRGREAFDDGWIESRRVSWLNTTVMFVLAVGATAGTVWVLSI